MNRLIRHKLVYLGTPYTKYPHGIDAAFEDACELSGRLLERGVKVYSPIAHTHPIAIHAGLDPLDHKIWLPFDAAMMEAADAMCIGGLDTWRESYGVKHEVGAFLGAGKPIYYLDPVTLEVSDYEVASEDVLAGNYLTGKLAA